MAVEGHDDWWLPRTAQFTVDSFPQKYPILQASKLRYKPHCAFV